MRYDDREMLTQLNLAMLAAEADGFDCTAKAIRAVLLELKRHHEVVVGIMPRSPSEESDGALVEMPSA